MFDIQIVEELLERNIPASSSSAQETVMLGKATDLECSREQMTAHAQSQVALRPEMHHQE